MHGVLVSFTEISSVALESSQYTTSPRRSDLLEYRIWSHPASPASCHRPAFHDSAVRPTRCLPLLLHSAPLPGNLASSRRRSSSFSAPFLPGEVSLGIERLLAAKVGCKTGHHRFKIVAIRRLYHALEYYFR